MNRKTGPTILHFGLVLGVIATALAVAWWAWQPPAFAILIGKDMSAKTAIALTLPQDLDGLAEEALQPLVLIHGALRHYGAVEGPLPDAVPPVAFLPNGDQGITVVLERSSGQWNSDEGLYQLADILQHLGRRSSTGEADSLLPNFLPAPPPALEAIPQGRCWILMGSSREILAEASGRLRQDLGKKIWLAADMGKESDPIFSLALLMEVERADGTASLSFTAPEVQDMEDRAKTLGIFAEPCGSAGRVALNSSLLRRFPASTWGSAVAGPWVGGNGALVAVVVGHDPDKPLPNFSSVPMPQGVTLHPVGGLGEVQLTPVSIRHAALGLRPQRLAMRPWFDAPRRRVLWIISGAISATEVEALKLPDGWSASLY